MLTWTLFAILSAVCWALVNYIDKFLIDKYATSMGAFVVFANLLIVPILLLFVVFIGFQPITFFDLLLSIVGGLLYVYAGIPYGKSLQLEEASRIIPLYGFTPFFFLVFGYIFLGETISSTHIVALCFIVLGAFTMMKTPETSWRDILTPRPAFYWMIIASITFALFGVTQKLVLQHMDFWAAQVYITLGIFLGVSSFFIFSQERKDIYATWKKISGKHLYRVFVLTEVIDILANLARRYATVFVPVALVSAVSQVQYFFVLIFGIVFTIFLPKFAKEKISPKIILRKFVSILLIIGGVVLIELSL